MFLVFLFTHFLYKFVISRTKGTDKEVIFPSFFVYDPITNTMTNNESRDFVSIFSGKGLISSTIMINCSEFAKLTMRFHLLAAAQMGP